MTDSTYGPGNLPNPMDGCMFAPGKLPNPLYITEEWTNADIRELADAVMLNTLPFDLLPTRLKQQVEQQQQEGNNYDEHQ